MPVTESMVAADKERRAAKVERRAPKLPNKHNGTPVPPELPPGIPQEEPPVLPELNGRWPNSHDWGVAEVRALKMVFRRLLSEDQLCAGCPSQLRKSMAPAVVLPSWEDHDVHCKFDLSRVACASDSKFASKLAFVASFPPDLDHSRELWAHLTEALLSLRCEAVLPPRGETPAPSSPTGVGPSGGCWIVSCADPPTLVELNLGFRYVSQPTVRYSRGGLARVVVQAVDAPRRPLGFAAHAKQKGYCEMAAHLLAVALENFTALQNRRPNRPEALARGVVAYGFTVAHTAVKGWRASFPAEYLLALQQGVPP
eukprot:RCo009382